MSAPSTDSQPAPDTPAQSQEYIEWRNSVPYFYKMMMTHACSWPSQSVQWLDDPIRNARGCFSHRVVVSPHDRLRKTEHLNILDISIPEDDNDDDDVNEEVTRFKTIRNYNEVNRLRRMPQNSNILAAKTISPSISIYDVSDVSSPLEFTPTYADEDDPKLHDCFVTELTGMDSGTNWSLCWHPSKPGHLFSACENNESSGSWIYEWRIDTSLIEHERHKYYQRFASSQRDIMDISAVVGDHHAFVTVSDDKMILFWDGRNKKNTHLVYGHDEEVTSVDCSHVNGYEVITGSEDNSVKLWDRRKCRKPVHKFMLHKKRVNQVRWAPDPGHMFVSCGDDNMVYVWDTKRINCKTDGSHRGLTREAYEKQKRLGVPPEAIFAHGGHNGSVTEVDWCPTEKYLLTSTSYDNTIQIWKPNELFWEWDDMPLEAKLSWHPWGVGGTEAAPNFTVEDFPELNALDMEEVDAACEKLEQESESEEGGGAPRSERRRGELGAESELEPSGEFGAPPVKKRRGRPKKNALENSPNSGPSGGSRRSGSSSSGGSRPTSSSSATKSSSSSTKSATRKGQSNVPKRRGRPGRPRKQPPNSQQTSEDVGVEDEKGVDADLESTTSPQRKSSRTRKSRQSSDYQNWEDYDMDDGVGESLDHALEDDQVYHSTSQPSSASQKSATSSSSKSGPSESTTKEAARRASNSRPRRNLDSKTNEGGERAPESPLSAPTPASASKSKKPATPTSPEGEKMYQCPICMLVSFPSHRLLNYHMRRECFQT